jgi:hypothetical protein
METALKDGKRVRVEVGADPEALGVKKLIRQATRSAWDADDNAAEGEAGAPRLLGRHG